MNLNSLAAFACALFVCGAHTQDFSKVEIKTTRLGDSAYMIVAHENLRKRMGSEQFIEFLRTNVPASPALALPVVTFAGSVSFHLNGDEMRAIHVPRAHTDGDAIVHFVKSDVIHMGDTYFNRKMVADGRKLEDITASDASAEFDATWGKGFIQAGKFREMIAMNILRNR